jgi:hypothetical protein
MRDERPGRLLLNRPGLNVGLPRQRTTSPPTILPRACKLHDLSDARGTMSHRRNPHARRGV